MHDPDRSELLQAYKHGPTDLRLAMESFPKEMWAFKPASNSWSIHEIVVHLGDTEVQSHVRFRTTIAEPSTTIPYHDEYRWSQALEYSNQSVPVSLEIISHARVQLFPPHVHRGLALAQLVYSPMKEDRVLS